MKKHIAITCSMLVFLAIPMFKVTQAREIGDLTYFMLPAANGYANTQELKKSTSNYPWVINLSSDSVPSVTTYLANSAQEARSIATRVYQNTRVEIPSTGTANFLYHARIKNYDFSFSQWWINGSWSPDKS